ncbi:MAG: ABC transporter permease [Patescibacteria group bacterium]|nr:ABC transporter permease [Patescibacteria group bacterium]
MKTRDLAKLSTRMFKARTIRTLLTILGMGIGIGAILFLVSLGYGLQRVLLETITASDSLLTVDVFPKNAEGKFLSAETVGEIRKISGVSETSPARDLDAQVKFGDSISNATAIAVDPEFLKLSGTKVSQGELLSQKNSRGIVVSSTFAKIFNLEEEKILGREISFSLAVPKNSESVEEGTKEKKDIEGSFEIIGIVKSEDVYFFADASSLESAIGLSDFTRLKVKCKSSQALNEVKTEISSRGYEVSSLSETVDEVNKFFKIINFVLALFGVIALVVSAIGMFNTMTVALMERTQEIGIMKAVGASDRDIKAMFIAESTIMGFLGGIAGLILGIMAGKLLNIFINTLAERLGGKAVSLFFYPAWFVLLIIALAVLVGFVTGVVPARRASQVDPLEALQYK